MTTRFERFADDELAELLTMARHRLTEFNPDAAKYGLVERLISLMETEQNQRAVGIKEARSARIFYFGCNHTAGHYFWLPHMQKMRYGGTPAEFPWAWAKKYDGSMCPEHDQQEGVAKLTHAEGWTALGFWDRSVDKRGGSNSTFFVHYPLDFSPMLALCKLTFPEVFERLTFEVKEG